VDVDLIIVGGGLAGNCLALSLQNTDLKIAIIEAQSRQTLDGAALGDRALALEPLTRCARSIYGQVFHTQRRLLKKFMYLTKVILAKRIYPPKKKMSLH
jgi:flavin-dependent dehydrogenase